MFQHLGALITCAEFEEFILDYFEERLSPTQARVFKLHLKMCPECRDYLKAYRRTVALGKAVFERVQDAVPTEVPEDLVIAILAARSAASDDTNGETPSPQS